MSNPRNRSRTEAAAHPTALHWALRPTPLGWALIVASSRGLRAIDLDDDADALRARLATRFPTAQPEGAAQPERAAQPEGAAGPESSAEAPLAAWADEVAALLAEPARGLAAPLDAQGTPFQLRVWQALGTIPPGQTLTYAQLTARLGLGAASVRAVAGACAANPLAVAIPCHRVVGSGGALTGYRWGLARKRALLTSEAPALLPLFPAG